MSSVKFLRFARCVVPCVLAAALLSPVAYAQATNPTPEEKARLLFESGKAARDAKDLPEALRLFRESHETYASPSLDALVKLADCENALGKTAAAYLHYDEFLRNVKIQDARIAAVNEIMQAMKTAGPWIRIARRDLLEPNTIVQINAITLGPVRDDVEDIPAEIGDHSIIIREPGKSEKTIVVKVEAGKHAVVDFRRKLPNPFLTPQPVGPDTPKPLPHWVLPVGILVAGAGAFTSLVMGAGFAAGAVRENETNPRESDRLSTTAAGIFIAGGVLTAATVVLIVVNHRKQKDFAFVPLPLPSGGGASLIGQF